MWPVRARTLGLTSWTGPSCALDGIKVYMLKGPCPLERTFHLEICKGWQSLVCQSDRGGPRGPGLVCGILEGPLRPARRMRKDSMDAAGSAGYHHCM